jgi:hypothetical protein
MQARVRKNRWQFGFTRRLKGAMGRSDSLKNSIANQALEIEIQAAEGTWE